MDKDQLIEKWLNHGLTDAELETFVQLEDYELNIAIIDNAKFFKASEISTVEDFKAFKKRYNARKAASKNRQWLKPLLRFAAVFVIAFGVYFILFFNNLVQIETMAGQKSKIDLPDHSQVTLNALSKIEYNERHWESNRKVYLDGEAYFKVASGNTFEVITIDGTVSVVGTKFNVKQRAHYFEVNCFEGTVKVVSDGKSKTLEKGGQFRILNGHYLEGQSNLEAPIWMENKSVFEAIPFKEVLAEVERQYDIEITYKNINTNRLFTGGFAHDNLENALIAITKPMNLTYELSSSKLVILHGENQ